MGAYQKYIFLRASFISLALTLFFCFTVFLANQNPFVEFKFFSFVIQALLLSLFLNRLSKFSLQHASFKYLLKTGVLITLVYATLFAFFTYLITHFFKPNLLNWTISILLENMESVASVFSDENLNQFKSKYKEMSLLSLCLSEAFSKTISGILISLVCGLIYKKV